MQLKGIRTQHPEYTRMLPVWERCERAAEGEIAVHAAAEVELPRLEGETDTAYKARLKRTPFFNATWRTISGLKGMLFRKSPSVTAPAAIEPYLPDVDMAGTPIAMFAQEIAEEVLTVGRVGVLVDHPSMPANPDGTPITVAQAERLGLRPMLAKYSAKSCINWKTARVNNAVQLVLVVLKESAPTGTDEYSHDAEDRYRELTLTPAGYRQRVFRINARGEDEQVGDDVYPRIGGQTLTVIPFTFIGTDDLSADVESPPLLDLVTMNYHHYTVSADYEHGCHMLLPAFYVTGFMPEDGHTIYFGGMANTFPNPETKVGFAQPEQGFKDLKENKDDKKAEMAVLGARMLEEQRASVEAAETLQTRSQGEQSQLAAMAHVLSMGLTKALEWFAAWAGAAGDTRVEINRDFVPVGMSAQELTALVAAWQAGMPGASGQSVYRLMQAKEMADPAVSYEEEQERIASAGPVLQA